jgi:hypothetical protein
VTGRPSSKPNALDAPNADPSRRPPLSESFASASLQSLHHVQPTNRDQLKLTGGAAITLTYNAAR